MMPPGLAAALPCNVIRPTPLAHDLIEWLTMTPGTLHAYELWSYMRFVDAERQTWHQIPSMFE